MGLAGGRAALRGLLGRLLIWRVNWRWWAAAALVLPALLVLTGLAYNLLGGQPPILAAPQTSIAALLINVFFLLVATLGEEIGWRGLALPTLQLRHSAFVSSAILGILWAAWHIPFWLLMDTFDQFGPGYLAFNFLFVLPMTFYITWFYNHGQSSLLLVAASHVAFNIVNVALFPVTTNLVAFGIFTAVCWIIALLVMPRLEPPGSAK
jgi:membrane protease YdiL (CAAX protease family)